MTSRLNNETILQIVNRGLDSLGESPKNALWYYLTTEFNFDQQKLHENLASFQEILQKLFGAGYPFLDSIFRHYLEEVTGEKCDANASFVECVECLCTKQQAGQ
jgi:hypothetical protein